jgi:predicted acetyltransferase
MLYSEEVAAMPGMAYYVARLAGEPVSTALGLVNGAEVGIFNVATPPQHRRRGFGAAVTERAIRDGFAAGADLAWLQSSELGEPVYRRMGFRQVETYVLLSRPSEV